MNLEAGNRIPNKYLVFKTVVASQYIEKKKCSGMSI